MFSCIIWISWRDGYLKFWYTVSRLMAGTIRVSDLYSHRPALTYTCINWWWTFAFTIAVLVAFFPTERRCWLSRLMRMHVQIGSPVLLPTYVTAEQIYDCAYFLIIYRISYRTVHCFCQLHVRLFWLVAFVRSWAFAVSPRIHAYAISSMFYSKIPANRVLVCAWEIPAGRVSLSDCIQMWAKHSVLHTY